MIGRSARALTSRASVRPSIRGISRSMISRSGQADVEAPERLFAVAGGGDVEAVVAQLVGQRHEEPAVVVDEEDPWCRVTRGR